MNELKESFPFSKEEFGQLCAIVDLLILKVVANASEQYPQQTMQILQGYQSLNYPLLLIWEAYGFGKLDDISSGLTSPALYQTFKLDAVNVLEKLIEGVERQNPFDFYGKIVNSEKVVENLLKVYSHLFVNLELGRLEL